MKRTVNEFREFLLKQNALALAIGVIIGAAIGKVVSGLVEDILMPIIGLVMPAGDWRNAQVPLGGNSALKYGDFLGRVVDFVIISAVVFFMLRSFLDKPAPAPATKTCPQCLEVIPQGAQRCRACASPV
jgi:large conductance mechanosensitive channel